MTVISERLRRSWAVFASALVLVIAASAAPAPAMATEAGAISGHVSLAGSPAGEGEVRVTAYAWRQVEPVPLGEVTTGADGGFIISNVSAGEYVLEFTYLGADDFADAWWVDPKQTTEYASDYRTAYRIQVWGSSPVVADITLPLAASISGVARDSAGTPLVGADVVAYRWQVGGHVGIPFESVTSADGTYSFDGLVPNDYRIRVMDAPTHLDAWYGSSLDDSAKRVTLEVEAGGHYVADTVSFIPASLAGRLTCPGCSGAEANGWGASISVERWNGTDGVWTTASSAALGATGDSWAYATPGLYAGTYRVFASLNLDSRPFKQSGPFTVTESFDVAEGQHVTKDVTVTGPEIERLAGNDRYATAVEVSKRFEPGVPVAFLASGFGFPDALSAGPAAAAMGGPVLLVTGTSIPSVVQAELQRLQPKRIIVVGGEAVVSAAVFRSLAGFAPDVERIGGADRYDTSRLVAMRTFGPGGAQTAYVASGLNFPDAVSAGAAAAHHGGPVLLVNGGDGAVDAATTLTLTELGATSIRVVGGIAVVHPGIESSLETSTSATVVRYGGEDRYDTSYLVNANAFLESPVAFLASGLNFPDALSGAAYAGASDAPLFLTEGGCVTDTIFNDLKRMRVQRVILLGGTAVISKSVEALATC